ncbi:MAG: ABC transporter ATP-binding protein [Candidatus Protistobacter heckmanni]|nr:ABC transporter ATP-binding protein [Candidatus Protistobacter heckmanni]
MNNVVNMKPELALELTDVHKKFGQTAIIRGVNLSIPKGERHALIGPNGAGKSTTFNLISGRFAPTSGRVMLNGKSIAGKQPFEINRMGLSRSFQITNIFHRLSVFENIRCAVLWSLGYKYSFWHRLGALRDAKERADQVLEEIGITIAGGAEVILLDEPTAGMSRSESDHAVEMIRRVTEGKTLVMVEHDMSVVFGLADRISVLVYGEVIATDTPAAIRANQKVKEAYLGTMLEESH